MEKKEPLKPTTKVYEDEFTSLVLLPRVLSANLNCVVVENSRNSWLGYHFSMDSKLPPNTPIKSSLPTAVYRPNNNPSPNLASLSQLYSPFPPRTPMAASAASVGIINHAPVSFDPFSPSSISIRFFFSLFKEVLASVLELNIIRLVSSDTMLE